MRERNGPVKFHSIKENIVLIRDWSAEENGISESKKMRTEIDYWICPLEDHYPLSHERIHGIRGRIQRV